MKDASSVQPSFLQYARWIIWGTLDDDLINLKPEQERIRAERYAQKEAQRYAQAQEDLERAEKALQEIEDKNNREKIASSRANVERLRNIQIGFSLVMLGGYVRLVATGMNILAPQTLDNAFEGGDWVYLLGAGTAMCLALDFVYFWSITRRDKCDLEERIEALEEAKKQTTTTENRLTINESSRILKQIRDETETTLMAKQHHAAMINIISNDILIQELLIRSEIDKVALIEQLKKEKGDIFSLMNDLSMNVSLNNYQYSHKTFQLWERRIEYAQAIKIPFRYTGLLLLLNHRGFDYPDISSYTGFKIYEDEPIYEWIILGSAILFAINLYAFYIEFKKNDNITELDKRIRKTKSAHHNALMSTILMTLDRKIKSNQIDRATEPQQHDADETLFGIPIKSALWIKTGISVVGLGSLARRIFTSWGLSNQDKTPTDVFAVLASIAVCVAIIDIIHISLSVTEERWKIKNKKEKNYVLAESSKLEQQSNLSTINLDEREKILSDELKRTENSRPSKFKTEHKYLYQLKQSLDKLLCVKFALRAMSLSWAIIELRAKEDFKNKEIVGVDATVATIVICAAVGFILGYISQKLNTKKEKILNPPTEAHQHTKNTVLFFKKPIETSPHSSVALHAKI